MGHQFERMKKPASSAKAGGRVTSRPVNTQVEPSTVPPGVREVLRSRGQPLDATTRMYMEPRFGHDFSKVRVHADARASEVASSIGAQAFTSNHSIVFGAGEYAPQTDAGRRLLSHELAHVTQQAGAPLREGVGEADGSYERHANEIANEVAQGGSSAKPLKAMNYQFGNTVPSVMRQKAGKAKDTGLPGEKEMAIGHIGKVVDLYGRETFRKIFALYNPRNYSDEQRKCVEELEYIAARDGQNLELEYFEDFLKSVGARANANLNPKHLSYETKPRLKELEDQVWNKAPDTAKELWKLNEDYTKKKLSTRQEGFLLEYVEFKNFTRAEFFEWILGGMAGKPEEK